MPYYEYRCTEDDCEWTTTHLRPIADRDKGFTRRCPGCQRQSRYRRILSPTPGKVVGPAAG